MKFYSTRKKTPEVDFITAIFQGLAPDGGLYMPRMIPQFSQKELATAATLEDVACMVMRKWMDSDDISNDNLKPLIQEAFTFPIPLVRVGDYSILELFHGPTMAFKDIPARMLARLFEFYLEKEKKNITILVSTSGDTGGAIAQAFSGISRVRVVVLYPTGKVSELQEDQLTRVDENVLSIAIDGAYDDCQSFVKHAFREPDLEKFHLTTANSINIGRLLPQVIYYVWAYVQSREKTLRFVVPSGNMGNATAALLAQRMGIPIASLIIATNENDVAVQYYKTGIYQSKQSVQTLSTAMDIGNPSNFERILELFQNNHDEFCKLITAVKVTDTETRETIKKVYGEGTYLMDFHTAVAYCAAEKLHVSGLETIIVSTASPVKFAKEMKEETGLAVDNREVLNTLRKKEKRVVNSSSDYGSIKKILLKRLGK